MYSQGTKPKHLFIINCYFIKQFFLTTFVKKIPKKKLIVSWSPLAHFCWKGPMFGDAHNRFAVWYTYLLQILLNQNIFQKESRTIVLLLWCSDSVLPSVQRSAETSVCPLSRSVPSELHLRANTALCNFLQDPGGQMDCGKGPTSCPQPVPPDPTLRLHADFTADRSGQKIQKY